MADLKARGTLLRMAVLLCFALAAPDCSRADEKELPQTRVRPIDEYLLFQPARHPVGNWQPKDLTFQNVWFESKDGTRLHAWYCPAEQPISVILYLHGNAGNLSHRADVLRRIQQRHRATVLIPDYRGYGRSEGDPTAEKVIEDSRAARAELAKLASVGESDIVLLGRSLGGAMAIQIAQDVTPRGMIIESSFHSYHAVARHHAPKLAWLVPADKLHSEAKLAGIKSPLLMSHGDRDRVIPFESGVRLFQSAQQPKWFFRIAGGDHNDVLPVQYVEVFDRFLRALPQPSSTGK